MGSASLGVVLFVLSLAKPEASTAADAVTLRDGSVVLGQLAESGPREPLLLYVRRAWAEAHLPDRARRWEAAEEPEVRRGARLRRDRLEAWRRERAKPPAAGADRIGAWLDRQLDGPPAGEGPTTAPLMTVKIARSEVKGIARRPRASSRMFRRGWILGLHDVEEMKPADLAAVLEGRGFAADGEETVSIDDLLPTYPETDQQWLTRRAATEVMADEGLRFIQVQDILMPEPGPGQILNANGALSMVGALAPLLEGRAVDPLAEQLKSVAARGRVGAVVTEQEMSPDLSGVRVTISLWVRDGDRWSKAGSKTSAVRADAIRPGAADDLAADPQVDAVFRVFESIGVGFSPELKRRSLNVGGATRQALGTARSAFAEQMAALRLPIEDGAAK